MAFSQNLERKSLSDIPMHFQMLMGSSSFSDIVPKMQHLLEKQRMQRRSLDAIRRIFGMGPTIVGIGGTVSSEDSVVDVIRAYTSNQGLSSAWRAFAAVRLRCVYALITLWELCVVQYVVMKYEYDHDQIKKIKK